MLLPLHTPELYIDQADTRPVMDDRGEIELGVRVWLDEVKNTYLVPRDLELVQSLLARGIYPGRLNASLIEALCKLLGAGDGSDTVVDLPGLREVLSDLGVACESGVRQGTLRVPRGVAAPVGNPLDRHMVLH